MRVIGSRELVVGLRLAGIGRAFIAADRQSALNALSGADKKELIIVTQTVASLLPELSEYANAVVFPDSHEKFEDFSDLEKIVKQAVGVELKV